MASEPPARRRRVESVLGSIAVPSSSSGNNTGTAGGASSLADQEAARKRYHSLVAAVRVWDTMQMFHLPVTEADAPGYSEVIESPIDLQTIDARIDAGFYSTDEELLHDDLSLMVQNATRFNERGSAWYNHAKALKKRLPVLFAQHGVRTRGSEEATYIPKALALDEESTLLRAEKKAKENVVDTLARMKEDMTLSIEELRKKYARPAPAAATTTTKEDAPPASRAPVIGESTAPVAPVTEKVEATASLAVDDAASGSSSSSSDEEGDSSSDDGEEGEDQQDEEDDDDEDQSEADDDDDDDASSSSSSSSGGGD